MAAKTDVPFRWTTTPYVTIKTTPFSSSRWSIYHFADMLPAWHERACRCGALIALVVRLPSAKPANLSSGLEEDYGNGR